MVTIVRAIGRGAASLRDACTLFLAYAIVLSGTGLLAVAVTYLGVSKAIDLHLPSVVVFVGAIVLWIGSIRFLWGAFRKHAGRLFADM